MTINEMWRVHVGRCVHVWSIC